MSPIVPAVIPNTFGALNEFCEKVRPLTHEIQVDIVDGQFVPFSSWPYNSGDSVADITELAENFLIEVDLMITSPEVSVEEYLQAGVRRVVIHLESTTDLRSIHQLKKKYDFRLGLSLNNDTELSKLIGVIEYADYVQCMGIKDIGAQGQPFDERVLGRIKELKEKFPTLLVSVDGSVNTETLPRIIEAGAERCAVGSALLKAEHMYKTYQEMCALFGSAC